MAKFVCENIKFGYEGKRISIIVAIKNIIFEETDEVVRIPDTFEGRPITHLGYTQDFEPAHEVWCDWHHPSKGSDYVEDKYTFKSTSIRVPSHVKKLIFPKTLESFGYLCILNSSPLEYEAEEGSSLWVNDKGELYQYKNNLILKKINE